MGGRRKTEGIHLTARPLHLLEYIQRAVHDELVHGPRLVGEVRRAVAALLRRAELILEEGVVLRADYHEVVRHVGRAVAPSGRVFERGAVSWGGRVRFPPGRALRGGEGARWSSGARDVGFVGCGAPSPKSFGPNFEPRLNNAERLDRSATLHTRPPSPDRIPTIPRVSLRGGERNHNNVRRLPHHVATVGRPPLEDPLEALQVPEAPPAHEAAGRG